MLKSSAKLAFAIALASVSACGSKGDADQIDRTQKPENPGAEPGPEPAPRPGLVLAASEGSVAANGQFVVKATWTDGPKVDRDNHLTLVFADGKREKPVSVEGVELVQWMPQHDHGAPRDSMRKLSIVPRADAPHEYEVSMLHFIMSGDWELRIDATVNGVADRALVTVSVP